MYLTLAPRWYWWLAKFGGAQSNGKHVGHQWRVAPFHLSLCRCGLLGLYSLACEMVIRLTAFSLFSPGCCIGQRDTDLHFLICGSERTEACPSHIHAGLGYASLARMQRPACVLPLCSHVCGLALPGAETEQGWMNLANLCTSWWCSLAEPEHSFF